MRTIKFRGKTTERLPAEWVYGSYVETTIPLITSVPPPYILNDEGCWHVDPATVGEFTGLVDKNGVEIYEGDILDFDEKEWGGDFDSEEVRMEDILGQWNLCGSMDDVRYYRSVAGNIHDQ